MSQIFGNTAISNEIMEKPAGRREAGALILPVSYALFNEGYDLKQATVFVGNHFLLSERQRLAIMRSIATDRNLMERKRKTGDPGVVISWQTECIGCLVPIP